MIHAFRQKKPILLWIWYISWERLIRKHSAFLFQLRPSLCSRIDASKKVSLTSLRGIHRLHYNRLPVPTGMHLATVGDFSGFLRSSILLCSVAEAGLGKVTGGSLPSLPPPRKTRERVRKFFLLLPSQTLSVKLLPWRRRRRRKW